MLCVSISQRVGYSLTFIAFFLLRCCLENCSDPLHLFAATTAFIVSFSFMVSGASSMYFKGLMFIIFQKPYDIGDRINVSRPYMNSPATGASGWIVKDVTL